MKQELYSYFNKVCFILFFLLVGHHVLAQDLTFNKTVFNVTTGMVGTNASQTNILEYTINVTNLTSSGFTAASLIDLIPAGTAYVPGSTTLNAILVADLAGKMPFSGTGGVIQSAGAGPGVLLPGVAAVIKFRVTVTANGGTVTNFGIAQYTKAGIVEAQKTNTVFTNLTPDPQCSVVYESTAQIQSGTPQATPSSPYRYIKVLNTTNGTSGPILYNGATGPCFNAITGATMAAGSLLTYTAAIAFEKSTNRLYFVNNVTNAVADLGYVDLNASPVCVRTFPGYPLETTVGLGWNINRMAFASDGKGYAITQSGTDLIQFYINTATGLPVITRLGPLINDATNAPKDVLAETGGDIFADGSGNLYLMVNSGSLYKINPATRNTIYLGTINPVPTGANNSLAIDASGTVYTGGAYQDAFKINLSTMGATSLTGGSTTNVWTSGDYSTCAMPVLAPALEAIKTYRNLRNGPGMMIGDTVEYTLSVQNTGNINAAGVKLYDQLPVFISYLPNSTTLNGITFPDIGGLMPYSISGGNFVKTAGEQNGIVKPGAANKAVVKFRVKITNASIVCNQARITLFDVNGNVLFVNTTDTSQVGSENPTCFTVTGSILDRADISLKGKAVQYGVDLKWETNAATDIKYFEMESSYDGSSFSKIGQVEAKENLPVLYSYTYHDQPKNVAMVYYRVKTVKTNGKYTYSNVVRVPLRQVNIWRIYPNPLRSMLEIDLVSPKTGEAQIRFIDGYGKVLYARKQQVMAGASHISLKDLAGLPKGIIIMEMFMDGDEPYRQKLIKQ